MRLTKSRLKPRLATPGFLDHGVPSVTSASVSSRSTSAPWRIARLWLAASAVATAALLAPAQAAPIACSSLSTAVTEATNRARDRVSADEAATAEAIDAAKQCLADVAKALNKISIPSISLSIDFSGIISGLIKRACQVVTTQINEAGQVVNGTVSSAANRVIGDVSSAIPLPVGSKPVVTGGVGSTAITPSTTSASITPSGSGLGTTISVPSPAPAAPPPGLLEQLSCKIRGTC